MADCHFQYLPPRVTAPMQRASIEFRRSVARAPVFSVPLISIFLHVASLAVRRFSVLFRRRPVPIYPSLSHPAATTVTGDYGKATRRDGDNGCIACVRGKDRRGVASMVDGGGRDEERKMSRTRDEIVGEKGRARRVRRMEREKAFLSPIRPNSDPALLSRHANSTTAG